MNINLNRLNKKDIQKKFVKETQSKKIFEDKNYLIFIKGEIFIKEYTLIKKIISFYKTNKTREISNAFNGNYVIFFYDKNKYCFFASNSQTSYYDLFYNLSVKGLNIKINLFKYLKNRKYKINKYKLFEWLCLSGRSLTNETVFRDIHYLLPGETIFQNKDGKITLLDKKYLSYKNKKISIQSLLNALKKSVYLQTSGIKSKLMLGLTGGLDSRILAGLVNKDKTISYTYGNNFNFEKIISKYVSDLSNIKNHLDINISEGDYFPNKILSDYIEKGNLNTTFQHNYQSNFFQRLTKKNNAKHIMLGCALDQFLGSSFSNKELLKVKNEKQYFSWFKKKFFIFKEKELKIIFGKEYNFFLKKLKFNFFKIIDKFKYTNFIDLNDALNFEIRILRWYNRNLNFVIGKNRKILSPTYDKYFLKLSFETNYKLRLQDFYRKNLLKKINLSLYNTPSLSNFLPPSAPDILKEIYKKNLNKLEHISMSNEIIKQTPSLLYDVNIARIINHSKFFTKFKNLIILQMRRKKTLIRKINFLNKLVVKQKNKISLNEIKKIIFLLSFYNINLLLNDD